MADKPTADNQGASAPLPQPEPLIPPEWLAEGEAAMAKARSPEARRRAEALGGISPFSPGENSGLGFPATLSGISGGPTGGPTEGSAGAPTKGLDADSATSETVTLPAKTGSAPLPAEGAMPAASAPIAPGDGDKPAALVALDKELSGRYESDEPWILINRDPSTNKPIFDASRTRHKIFMASLQKNIGLFPGADRAKNIADAHAETEAIMARAMGAATGFPITETKAVDLSWMDTLFPASSASRQYLADGVKAVADAAGVTLPAVPDVVSDAAAAAHTVLSFPTEEARTLLMGVAFPKKSVVLGGQGVPEHEVVGSLWDTLDWALRPMNPISNTAAALIKFGNTDSPDAREFIRTGGGLADAVGEISKLFRPVTDAAFSFADAAAVMAPAAEPIIDAALMTTFGKTEPTALHHLFDNGVVAPMTTAQKSNQAARNVAWGITLASMLAEPGTDLAVFGLAGKARAMWAARSAPKFEKYADAFDQVAQGVVAQTGNPVEYARTVLRRVLPEDKALETLVDTYFGGLLGAGSHTKEAVGKYMSGAAELSKKLAADAAKLRAAQTVRSMEQSLKDAADMIGADAKLYFGALSQRKLTAADLTDAMNRVARLGVQTVNDIGPLKTAWQTKYTAAAIDVTTHSANIARTNNDLATLTTQLTSVAPGSAAEAAIKHEIIQKTNALNGFTTLFGKAQRSVSAATNVISRLDRAAQAHAADVAAAIAEGAARSKMGATLATHAPVLPHLGIQAGKKVNPDKLIAQAAKRFLAADAAAQKLAGRVADATDRLNRAARSNDEIAQGARDLAAAFRQAAVRVKGGVALPTGTTKEDVLFRSYHNLLINPDKPEPSSIRSLSEWYKSVRSFFDLDQPAREFGGANTPEVGQAAFGAINFIATGQEELYRLITNLDDQTAIATIFKYIDSTAPLSGAREGGAFSWVNSGQLTLFARGKQQILAQMEWNKLHGTPAGSAFDVLSRALLGNNIPQDAAAHLPRIAEKALTEAVSLEDFIDKFHAGLRAFNGIPAKPGSKALPFIASSGNELRNVTGAALAMLQAAGVREGAIKLARSVNGVLDEKAALAARAVIVGNYGDVAGSLGKATQQAGSIESAFRFLDMLGMRMPTRGVNYGTKEVAIDFTKVGEDLRYGSLIFPTNAIKQIEDHIRLRAKRFDELMPKDLSHSPATSWAKWMYTLYQRNLVAGTVPFIRVANWTNNYAGDLSQIFVKDGAGKASRVGINTIHASGRDVLLNIPAEFLTGFSGRMGAAFKRLISNGQQITHSPVTLTGSMLNPHIGAICRGDAGVIVSRTGKFRYSYDEIREFVLYENIYNPQITEDLYATTTMRAKTMMNGPLSGAGALIDNCTEAALDISETFQNRMRIAHFLDGLLFEEKSVREAAKATREALFDWKHGYNTAEVSSWQAFMIPFYRFYRHGFVQTALTLMEPFVKPMPNGVDTGMSRLRNLHMVADKVPQWYMQEMMRGGIGIDANDQYLSPDQQRIRAEVTPDWASGRGHFTTQAPDFYSAVYNKYKYKNPTHVLWMMPPLTPIQFGSTFAGLGAVAHSLALEALVPGYTANDASHSIYMEALKPLMSQSLQIASDAIVRGNNPGEPTATVPLNPGETMVLREMGAGIGWLAAATPHGSWLREELTRASFAAEPIEYKRGEPARARAHPFVKMALNSLPAISGYTKLMHAEELTGTVEGDLIAGMMMAGVVNPYPEDPEDTLMYHAMDVKKAAESEIEPEKQAGLQARDRLR